MKTREQRKGNNLLRIITAEVMGFCINIPDESQILVCCTTITRTTNKYNNAFTFTVNVNDLHKTSVYPITTCSNLCV